MLLKTKIRVPLTAIGVFPFVDLHGEAAAFRLEFRRENDTMHTEPQALAERQTAPLGVLLGTPKEVGSDHGSTDPYEQRPLRPGADGVAPERSGRADQPHGPRLHRGQTTFRA